MNGWRAMALLAVGLAGAAFWLGRESAPQSVPALEKPEESVDRAAQADDAASPSPAARGKVVAPPAHVAAARPLPAAGTPLAAIHDELASRARAGDVAAACRLGAELMRCRAQRRMAGYSRLMQKSLEARTGRASDATVDVLAMLQESTEAADTLCADIGDEQMDEAIEFQRLAAERGDAHMRLWYASDPALDRENFLADLDEWSRYRADAPAYLQQALAAGDPEAPAALQQVYAPRGIWGPASDIPLRQPDEHLYFVYRELSAMLHPPPENPPRPPGAIDLAPQPGPDVDMAAVRAEAEQLRQKYYADYLPTPLKVAPVTFVDRNDPAAVCGE